MAHVVENLPSYCETLSSNSMRNPDQVVAPLFDSWEWEVGILPQVQKLEKFSELLRFSD
jgi:hypothetical protein